MTDKQQTLILLLCGDTAERLALRKALKELLGWRVLLAGDAASATSIVGAQRPDAIFLDCTLGEESDTIPQVRASCPDLFAVPAFLLSSPDDQIPAELLVRGGIHEVLQKPLEAEPLEQALERARLWSARVSLEREQLLVALGERLETLQDTEKSGLGNVERCLAQTIASQAARALSEAGSLQDPATWQRIFSRLLDAGFLETVAGNLGGGKPNAPTLFDNGLLAERATMTLVDLLQSLSARGLSGVLTVENETHGVRIYLESGAFVFIDFLRIPAELAQTREIYCQRYRIPFDELVRRLEAGDEGPVLVQLAAEDAFPESCLADALLEIGLEVLASCERDTASYSVRFENGADRLEGIPRVFKAPVNSFLLRLVSRADEWELFERSILEDRTFDIVSTGFEESRLSAYEVEVLDCLEQTSDIHQIPPICRLGTFEVCSAVYGLLRRKIVGRSPKVAIHVR